MYVGVKLLRVIILLIITLAAVYDDIKRYKISNTIIGVGLVAATVINVLDIFVCGGVVAGVDYLFGGVVAFLIMLVAYSVRAIGAGDVKLAGALGLFMGTKGVCVLIVLSFMYTGLVGMLGLVTGRLREIKLKAVKVHTVHYSVALLFSEICWIIAMCKEGWI